MSTDNGTITMEPPNGSTTPAVIEQPKAIAKQATVAMGTGGMMIRSIDELWRVANMVHRSGFGPKNMNPEAIAVAIQMGLEVGLSPMQAIQSIAVINGRPGIFGDAALALVRGSGLCDYYLEFASDNKVHGLVEELSVALEFDDKDEIKAIRKKIADASQKINRTADDFGYSSISKRKGAVTSTVRRFTIGDAKKAQLWGKAGPWSQYADRMLMWRSRGFNLRDNFGDVLKGVNTVEELRDMPGVVVDAVPETPVGTKMERLTEKLRSKASVAEPTETPPEVNQDADEVATMSDWQGGDAQGQ